MLSQTFDLVDEGWHRRESRRGRAKRIVKAGAVIIVAPSIFFALVEALLYPPFVILIVVFGGLSAFGVYALWIQVRAPDFVSMSLDPTGVLLGRKDGTSRRIPLESLRADIYLREFIHAPGEPSDSERVSHRYPVSFGALFDLKEGRPATLTKEARDGLMTWLPQAGFILKKTSRHKIRGRTVMVMQVYRRPRARRKPT